MEWESFEAEDVIYCDLCGEFIEPLDEAWRSEDFDIVCSRKCKEVFES